MLSPLDDETDGLLRRATQGDTGAVNDLMGRHRDRLERMVAIRMDGRLARRIDPSDVVQDTMAEASRRLPEYLNNRPIAFYPWLRQLAWNRLVDLYRYHVGSAKRSVNQEVSSGMGFSDESVVVLARQLAISGTSPSQNMLQKELREQVRSALEQLPEQYREVLMMRHLEQLPIKEIAVIVGVAKGTVKSRLFRGIEFLHDLLSDLSFGA